MCKDNFQGWGLKITFIVKVSVYGLSIKVSSIRIKDKFQG
jgi:hypothetical protein